MNIGWVRFQNSLLPKTRSTGKGEVYGFTNLWNDGGGLGKPRRLRPFAPRATGEGQGTSREIRDGRPAVLRHEQRPLPDGDAHRHLGSGQGQSLHSAAAERRANPVGFRIGR